MSGSLTPLGSVAAAPVLPTAAPTAPVAAPTLASGFTSDSFATSAREALTSPLHFASNQLIRLSAPLGVDGRYAAGGLVAGKVLATAIKGGSVGYRFVQISRDEGLRVFASRVGARGVVREAGTAFGRGWVRAVAVMGACLTIGIAAGFAAQHLQGPAAAPSPQH